jgi:heme-degrading monooxygenase HmoA
MITEVAVLDVRTGEADRFDAAFREASGIISVAPGFLDLRLQRCVETPNRYLLVVTWERLEDHTEGFRKSEHYQRWKALLHHFYDPFPTVEHYEPVLDLPPTGDAWLGHEQPREFGIE